MGSEANKLLLELGQDDFVALSSNTIFTIKMLNKMSEGISARDARALQGIIYSLGVNYLNVLDKLGFENFENFWGLIMTDKKMIPAWMKKNGRHTLKLCPW